MNKPAADSTWGALEFEITDFADARRVLDEPPAGVKAVQSARPPEWERRRREPSAADRALTGLAIDWMLALPPSLRPRVAAERYPRVLNAIAAAWVNPADRVAVVEHYLVDSRGDRRGFPLAVQTELDALRRHAQAERAMRPAR